MCVCVLGGEAVSDPETRELTYYIVTSSLTYNTADAKKA